MTPARPITIWAIFPGSGTRNGKPAICNIPGTCTGFTDLLGHVIAPYYTTVTATTVSGVNTDPAAYNSLLQFGARANRPTASGAPNRRSAISMSAITRPSRATVNKSFDDIDVKWLTAYRWWDNHGTSVSRGLPYDTTEYVYQVPDYKSCAVGTDRQWQRAGRQA